MAQAILEGNPSARFPNGLPLSLAALDLVFPSIWIPAIMVSINVLLSTAVVGLGMLISKKITGSPVAACLTGFIIAVFPNQLNYVRYILSEVPTTFFLVVSVYLLLSRNYFISGVLLCTAVLFRSSLLPVIPLLFICLYFFEDKKNFKIAAIKYGSGFTLIFSSYLVLIYTGVVKPSSNITQNLLISINSYSQDIDFSIQDFSNEEKKHPLKTYLKFAVENPVEFLKQRFLSLFELWIWPRPGEPQRNLLTKLLISLRLPVIIAAVFGFIKNIRTIEVWILFLPIFSITTLHTMFFSSARFTYVIEPFAITLAIVGLLEIFKKFKK